jgi:4-hydroxy-3-methylbut-2-enyl diphosphate reductase
MIVILAKPRGFCAGVDRAIEIVERALALHGAPIYVRHEIVHNKYVVDDLRAKGAVFVDELDEIPPGATVVFSAHGVSQRVRRDAQARRLNAFDATCPLVTKVHVEVARMHEQGREIVMIGHRGHPEVEGTMGQIETPSGGQIEPRGGGQIESRGGGQIESRSANARTGGQGAGVHLVESPADVARLRVRDPNTLAYVTQTTLSVDDAAAIVQALKARFPAIVGPKKDDICYATQNRQDAVKALARECDVVIVVGSPNSSNSNRLREVALNAGVQAYMVDTAAELDPRWVEGRARVGVTAGASAPEVLVRDLLARLRALGASEVREMDGIHESVEFPLPRGLAS